MFELVSMCSRSICTIFHSFCNFYIYIWVSFASFLGMWEGHVKWAGILRGKHERQRGERISRKLVEGTNMGWLSDTVLFLASYIWHPARFEGNNTEAPAFKGSISLLLHAWELLWYCIWLEQSNLCKKSLWWCAKGCWDGKGQSLIKPPVSLFWSHQQFRIGNVMVHTTAQRRWDNQLLPFYVSYP